MIDIIVPLPMRNAALAPEALEHISANTDVAHRYIVMLDGGVRDDYLLVERFLAGFDRPWKLLANTPSVGLNQTLREGLVESTTRMTAIIGPEVRLLDPGWFGKVQQIFHRDPVVGIVDTTPDTKSATLYPIKRAHNRPASPGCRFAVVQTAFAVKTPPYGSVDPIEHWSRSVMGQGGTSWAAPGVRYTVVEHDAHELSKVHVALPRG